MPIVIEGGTGNSKQVGVTESNELKVRADSNTRGAVVSDEDAQTYTWSSSYSAATGDEVIFIKNTSKTKRLFLDEAVVGSVLGTLFEMFDATGTSTQAGTGSTGQNLNLASNNTPDTTSMGNAAVTEVTLGNRVGMVRVGAGGNDEMHFDDELILSQNNSIAVSITSTANSVVNVLVHGYFDI